MEGGAPLIYPKSQDLPAAFFVGTKFSNASDNQ
jgi:hypothetical protein